MKVLVQERWVYKMMGWSYERWVCHMRGGVYEMKVYVVWSHER